MWLTKIVPPEILTKNTKLREQQAIPNLSSSLHRPLEIWFSTVCFMKPECY